jgi:hypothetical protein
MACGQARKRDGHSSRTPVTRRLQQPTRTAVLDIDLRRQRSPAKPRAVPIRSCSRWGLPCRPRCRRRGALLPHLFTLTAATRYAPRRYVLCGTFPRLAPAGRYPAPLVHGARTFLPGKSPSLTLPACGRGKGGAGAAVRPTDQNRDGGARMRRQEARRAKSRARAAIERTRPRCASRSFSVARVDSSAMPSTRSGRK